jgi:hypothetical protein
MPRPSRLVFQLLLLSVSAAPVAHSQSQKISVPATVDTLPNGLTLIVHEDHSVPTVATNVWFHVGSGDEKPGRTGFAHLFEHLMFMGSQHAEYPQFDRLLQGIRTLNDELMPSQVDFARRGDGTEPSETHLLSARFAGRRSERRSSLVGLRRGSPCL